ncbi:hypothetical protein TTHERM_000430029 (macronuclear) [Tetrahymena thermophila SB210]|uniref:Uncharacterized protein n=1 Tax=Tetrahymena thermophila (strain SB210) TaxID=312017 RepID=W7XF63_TETTS|nr:hypothetical protein TTHERM_000430029 [Tetrahymena thermophila SB210]EWS72621.1 hypothetical protein TTHERM_000430029 [Tetrahymena thermophila SB210]|eukprot:XP_012654904.1 hypothetical protein TTHERM_000430029 [Tetrahymena thermophila SB210]
MTIIIKSFQILMLRQDSLRQTYRQANNHYFHQALQRLLSRLSRQQGIFFFRNFLQTAFQNLFLFVSYLRLRYESQVLHSIEYFNCLHSKLQGFQCLIYSYRIQEKDSIQFKPIAQYSKKQVVIYQPLINYVLREQNNIFLLEPHWRFSHSKTIKPKALLLMRAKHLMLSYSNQLLFNHR